MSECRIVSTHTVALNAWMRAADVVGILKEARESSHGRIPENCFLHAMEKPAMGALLSGQIDMPIHIGLETNKKDLRWSGSGSGYGLDGLLTHKIAHKVRGLVEAIFFWEDGGAIGIRIQNGAVTRHKILYSLGDVL